MLQDAVESIKKAEEEAINIKSKATEKASKLIEYAKSQGEAKLTEIQENQKNKYEELLKAAKKEATLSSRHTDAQAKLEKATITGLGNKGFEDAVNIVLTEILK